MRKLCNREVVLGVGLVVVCIAARLAPHPPNLSPVAAAALFAGATFSRRSAGVAIALAAMFASDWAIGFYDPRIMACVYVAMVVPVLLARLTHGRYRALRLAGCAAATSVVFFAASNFGVWLFGGAYKLTPAGLRECYVAATPFFRYTLTGDVLWCGVFFGGHALAGLGLRRYFVLAPSGGLRSAVRLPSASHQRFQPCT